MPVGRFSFDTPTQLACAALSGLLPLDAVPLVRVLFGLVDAVLAENVAVVALVFQCCCQLFTFEDYLAIVMVATWVCHSLTRSLEMGRNDCLLKGAQLVEALVHGELGYSANLGVFILLALIEN